MPNPSSLRDSTQIVLPHPELDGIRPDLEEKFTVSVHPIETTGDVEYVRIIGSPVVIKEVADYLARHGVNLP